MTPLTPIQRAVLLTFIRTTATWSAASDVAASIEDGYLLASDPSLSAYQRLLALERKRLVERAPDGRPVLWRITDAGRQAVES